MNQELTVVKVGGSCLRDPSKNIAARVLPLIGDGSLLLVHGHGAELRNLLSRLDIRRAAFTSASGISSYFTTEEIADLSAFAAARVRQRLVRQFEEARAPTRALPAYWRGLVRGTRKARIRYVDEGVIRSHEGDYSGRVTEVDSASVAGILAESGRLILSAVLRGVDKETLAINGDSLAIELAVALNATRTIILTDRPGFLVNGQTVRSVTPDDIGRIARHAAGGMSGKLKHIKAGLLGGIGEILLLDGETPVSQGEPNGTVFTAA